MNILDLSLSIVNESFANQIITHFWNWVQSNLSCQEIDCQNKALSSQRGLCWLLWLPDCLEVREISYRAEENCLIKKTNASEQGLWRPDLVWWPFPVWMTRIKKKLIGLNNTLKSLVFSHWKIWLGWKEFNAKVEILVKKNTNFRSTDFHWFFLY